MLGGYHKFMISYGFGFHKVIYKRVRFSLQKHYKISTLSKGINIFFKKLTLVLTMSILENLNLVGYPLSILTNRVFLIFKNKKLFIHK